MAIAYLTYQQIDKLKWDNCIDNAPNGLIYAYSFYLSSMAKNWDALVLGDYEAVMPLTYKKKYGFYYLCQPPFTACLGVFGNKLTAELMNLFLASIPVKFKYWDIYFNYGNYFSLQNFVLYKRMNYVLDLNNEYEKLYTNFNENIKRNIKKAEKFALSTQCAVSITEITQLAKEQSNIFSNISNNDFDNFEHLYQQLYKAGEAVTYGVKNKEGQLLSAAVFFFSHNRAYYILACSHPDGKTLGASHALIDAFIRDYAGKDLILDFEGSDIPSLAFFYSSFGATEEKYSSIKLNRLPAMIKWLKN